MADAYEPKKAPGKTARKRKGDAGAEPSKDEDAQRAKRRAQIAKAARKHRQRQKVC